MKKALMIATVLLVAVISTACINNIAVQELNNKAAEYMQKGDYEAAMNRLQASLDLDATMYQTYYNLGVAAINAKKYDVAIDALENGLKLNSEFADFYYSLGVAQISKADEILETISEDDKQPSEADEDNKSYTKEDVTVLKQNSIKNLEKYLELNSNSKDKNSVEEMIAQSKEFLENGNGEGENRQE